MRLSRRSWPFIRAYSRMAPVLFKIYGVYVILKITCMFSGIDFCLLVVNTVFIWCLVKICQMNSKTHKMSGGVR